VGPLITVDLRYSALSVPKDGTSLAECEDSAAFSAEFSRVAVSDGAGSAFESRRWAQLLARAFVESPSAHDSPDEVLDWLSTVSAEWYAAIPWQELDFFQLEKGEQGSAATLVGVRFCDFLDGTGTWDCVALGDSCLFQVSGDSLVRSVPIEHSDGFGARPPLCYTDRPRSERDLRYLVTAHGQWTAGDRFLLLTDAIAQWFLSAVERGEKPWNTLDQLDEKSFAPFIDGLRSRRLMRNDDVTAVTITAEATQVPPPPQPSAPGRRRSRYALLLMLVIGLVLGILIGRLVSGGQAPGPAPVPRPTATTSHGPVPAVMPTTPAAGGSR
jgi:hypothetical protein